MQADSNQRVAQNLRRLRQERCWSQEELAARCRLHRTYIGAIERGERNITLKTLDQLARTLGVQAVALLTEAQESRP
jgi:transcriptional regulator with XRE-family HTH domain